MSPFPFKPEDVILLFDTETSGLPLFKEPSDHPEQPRIIQLTALLCDWKGSKLSSLDALIYHEGLRLSEDIRSLTGHTDAKLAAGGVPIYDAMNLFLAMMSRASLVVAHNIGFDNRMIRIELKRAGRVAEADYWRDAGKSFCTMAATRPILRLPPTEKMRQTARFADSYKSPNLAEAYRWATGKNLNGAHNAMYDVLAVKAILFALAEFHRTMAPEKIAEPAGKTGGTDGQAGGSPRQRPISVAAPIETKEAW